MPDVAYQPQEYFEFAQRYYVGASSFSEAYFVSELRRGRTGSVRPWGDYQSRLVRYSTYWAHYENNVYREVHLWSAILKGTYDLYRHTRSIFSPAYRLGEFWANHILGGSLDPLAGDGVSRPSALPIVTENELIRAPIGQVWRDSNWQDKKEIWTRFGAVMGDSAVMVVDDPVKQKVQFKVVDPRTLRDVVRDSYGNVKAYVIEELRPDPEATALIGPVPYATYTEACERVGESIRYATFRNGDPYDWRAYADGDARAGTLTEWTEDYGFVPLVFVQHRDVGQGWGWSEFQPSVSKLHEVDDVASKLNDWIRLTVDCPWLFTGVVPQGQSEAMGVPASSELIISVDADVPKGRSDIPVVYSNDKDTRAQSLVAPLDVAAVSAHLQTVLQALIDDHPELLADAIGPNASGEARKVAREKVEATVLQRRSGYDDAQVRADQMALSIGAQKGYPGFEMITAESYSRGELDHSIGPRPVFSVDQAARIAESLARATVVKTLTDAGVSKESAMRQAGWSDEEIAAELAAKQREDAAAMKMVEDRQRAMMADLPVGNGAATAANGFAQQ